MALITGASWLIGSGIILILFGFFGMVTELADSDDADGGLMLAIFIILIGALLCYAGSKLKGRKGGSTASKDKPDDDSGGRPWWKPDPKYDGALFQQQQRNRR